MNKESAFAVEFSERYLAAVPVGMFLIAVSFGAEAVDIYSGERWHPVLARIQDGIGIVVLLIGLPLTLMMMWQHIRHLRHRAASEQTGFAQDQFNRIAVRSFAFSLLLLLAVEEAGPGLSPDLPREFFFNAELTAIMLFFSLSFGAENLIARLRDRDLPADRDE